GQLARVELLRGLFDLGFKAADSGIERLKQGEVGFDAPADEGVGDVSGDGGALGLVFDVAGDGRQVGLAAGGVDVAVEFGALADEAQARAEQVAEAATFFGVGVGGREVATLEETGDGLGVLAITLGLAAVNGFHGPGVTEDESDVVVAAGVGEPVPGMDTL